MASVKAGDIVSARVLRDTEDVSITLDFTPNEAS
jgi:hypothetical protein